MIKKRFISISVLLVFAIVLSGCGGGNTAETQPETTVSVADTSQIDFSFSSRDTDSTYSEQGATFITLSNSGSSVSGNGAIAKDGKITVNSAGTYIITGSAQDTQLTVEAGDTDKLQLVFSGVTLSNSSGPAVYLKSADKVFITLAGGSKNTLSDGEEYTATDGETTLDAALFSRTDLCINGDGALTVNGNCKHAVISKDDLIITSGTIDVTSKNVGLGGKDCVKIGGGSITVNAGSDAVRSDNAEDSNRGFIYISNGSLSLTAGNDGIQAENVLKIDKAELTVISGGGSINASYSARNEWMGGWHFGGKDNSLAEQPAEETAESAKGLKSGSDIQITEGNFNIDSADDCIHSNGSITISGGSFNCSSGDDGIHADTALAISGGNIDISKSYEGLEGSEIVVSGGEIRLTATDDGINAAGGNDSSALGGRPGQGMFTSDSGKIVLSGGYTVINASGDGIDSNGTISVSGGVTLVSGPTDSGNGALDYQSSCAVTGGVFMALGSSGMAQGFSSAENQGAIFQSFSSQAAGTSFSVCDSNGKVIISFAPDKAYSCAAVTAPEIQTGGTYTLIAGGTIEKVDQNGYAENTDLSGGTVICDISLTQSLYSSGGGGMHGGGMGGPGGGGMMPPNGRR